MHASDLWYSSRFGARLGRGALWPASVLYAAGWQAYLACYQLGIKKAREPHRPVVCIGNLQVGGSGKTPLTQFVAKVLGELGYGVVVSCSGYGAPRSVEATFAPSGPLSASEWGDEPAMMRWLAPDLDLVVGRNRVRAAELIEERSPGAVMLMDDGFQHLPLKKHVTLLLDPAKAENHCCLPAGPYREPRKNRSRASTVVPSRFSLSKTAMQLVTPDGELSQPFDYSVLCALARPELFAAELTRHFPCQSTAGRRWFLPDHDKLDGGNLLHAFPAELPIVVTAKDWVKLRVRSDASERKFLIARQEVTLEPVDQFKVWLAQRLDVAKA